MHHTICIKTSEELKNRLEWRTGVVACNPQVEKNNHFNIMLHMSTRLVPANLCTPLLATSRH